MQSSKLDSFYTRQAPLYDITRQMILFDHQEAVRYLDIQPDDLIYDIACGTGKNITPLLKKINADHIHGFDYSHALLAQARKNHPGVQFYHADVTKPFAGNLPPPSKIICSYSLTMIQDWKQALTVMLDTLKPGGTLVILDFNPHRKPGRIGRILRQFLKWCHINLDQDIWTVCRDLGYQPVTHLRHRGYNAITVIHKPLH